MTLDDPEDRDVAAGEYVLGTLAGDDRARFEAALVDDAGLQRAVYDWQDRLVGLAARAAPIEPAATLWSRIEDRLGTPSGASTPAAAVVAPTTAAANDSFWNRIGTWRAATGLAMAASLLLAVALALRGPVMPQVDDERFLAVLQSPVEKSTGWLVEGTAGEGVRLVPIGKPAPPPPGKSLQFWTKPKGATGPTSLGLVNAGEITVVPIKRLPGLADQQLFEVTLEPEGGSTIGKPTGPVLFVGSTVHL